MYKKSNNKKRFSALLRISLVLAVLVFLFSCRNEDTQKQPVIVTDTAASPGSGRGAGDAASKMDSSMSGTKMISKEIKKDSAQSLGIARAKGKKADRLAAKIKDSLGAAGKASLPAVHDNNAAAADNSNINVSG